MEKLINLISSGGNVGSGCLESALAGLDLDNRNLHRAQAIISTVSQHTSNPKVLTQVSQFLCSKGFQIPEVGRSFLECQMVCSPMKDIGNFHKLLHYWTAQIGKCGKALRPHHFVDICLQTPGGRANFREVLDWEKDNMPQNSRVNRKILTLAALQDDLELVHLLFEFGYKIDVNFPNANRDHLKLMQVCSLVEEMLKKPSFIFFIPSKNLIDGSMKHEHTFETAKKLMEATTKKSYIASELSLRSDTDPLRRLMNLAEMARAQAEQHPDFAIGYDLVTEKCEVLCCSLLDQCKTTNEVEVLLQTTDNLKKTKKSTHDNSGTRGSNTNSRRNAIFEVALLDGHMEFVAHERFQQQLHLIWGRRKTKLHWSDDLDTDLVSWTEKSGLEKVGYTLQQSMFYIFVLWILPIINLTCWPKGCRVWMTYHTDVPVNKFFYWELSNCIYSVFLVLTVTLEDSHAQVFEHLSLVWALCYLTESIRSFKSIYQISQHSWLLSVRRWGNFRNLFNLASNLVLVIAYGFKQSGLRYSSTLWALAYTASLLRGVQSGLMWRQTGPIIISMSYMLKDILTFLGFFLTIYISFVIVTYSVYSEASTVTGQNPSPFVALGTTLKFYFWAMIKTGNPDFASLHQNLNKDNTYSLGCLNDTIRGQGASSGWIPKDQVQTCLRLPDDQQLIMEKSSKLSMEELSLVEGFGYPYWAGYQLLVVIILLSVLRARMINTYQNIRQEADIKWKFFRANLWWNYLEASLLPPPFTIIEALTKLCDWLFSLVSRKKQRRQAESRPSVAREKVRKAKLEKSNHKVYQNLQLVLLSEIGDTAEDEKTIQNKLANFESVRIEVAFD